MLWGRRRRRPRLLQVDARIEQVDERIDRFHGECGSLLGDLWFKAQAELSKCLRQSDLPAAKLGVQLMHRVRPVARHAHEVGA